MVNYDHFHRFILRFSYFGQQYNITRDTYTQCRPRARAFSRCGLVCMEVAVRTEPQKGQLDTPYAEENPIIFHNMNIIYIQTHNHFEVSL